jgi:pimeloyl-ACP methyl ester carboxylesterase
MKNILFIHGAWGGAWAFREFVEILKQQGHQASAIDLPGHGQNTARISEVTMEAYVNHVIETAKTIEGPIILVGHSLAGAVISQVGERIPERIERLVYVAASLPQNGETVTLMKLVLCAPFHQCLFPGRPGRGAARNLLSAGGS